MADETRQVLLMIADISGYTRFMTANTESLAHAQGIITNLIETIVAEVEIPLRIAKLEGDAIFLWAERTDDACKLIAGKLLQFLEAFAKRVTYLNTAHACECGGCSNIGKLELKLIVHSGEALFHRVAGFEELAGVDVILVHRLLKNSVESHEYILLTDPAFQAIAPPFACESAVESYDVGEVPVHIYVPPDKRPRVDEARASFDAKSAGSRIAMRVPANIKMFYTLIPTPLPRRAFGHDGVDAPVPKSARWLSIITRIFSPILLFLMSVTIVYRELRRKRGAS